LRKKKKEEKVLINENIPFEEIRLTSEDGENYGIVDIDYALDLAYEKGLDLVCIAPKANPPVCKIMDYGKYKYQQEKKKKEAKKKQKVIVTKEVKLSVKIADNDIAYKVKHAREFLEHEYHVKFRVFLKGREMANPEAAFDVLKKVWPMVEDLGEMESEPKLEGRYVNMLVVPKKKTKKGH